MTYQAVNHGGSRWELLLMQFEPESAHDGYEVVASQELLRAPGGPAAPSRPAVTLRSRCIVATEGTGFAPATPRTRIGPPARSAGSAMAKIRRYARER